MIERHPWDEPARTLSAFTADRLEGRTLPPRVWHTPGMIPALNVTSLDGDGGAGKSTLALQSAVATVARKEWLGQTLCQGRALYLSAEDDQDELHRRLHDITAHYATPFADLAGLKLWPLTDGDAVLATSDRDGESIRMTPLWEELHSMAAAWKPSLTVLDSRADIFAGNEISRSQTRQFIGRLRGLANLTGGAVLLLAHPSVSGMASGSGLSGSTAWNNSVRSRLYLTSPKTDGDPDPTLRVLSVKKANYAQAGGELRIRLSGGAFSLEGDAYQSVHDLTLARDRVDRLFLELLTTYDAQRRQVSDKPGANYAPAVFARDAAGNGTSKEGFADAMNRLFSARAIRVEETGPPSRRQRSLVRADRGGDQ